MKYKLLEPKDERESRITEDGHTMFQVDVLKRLIQNRKNKSEQEGK